MYLTILGSVSFLNHLHLVFKDYKLRIRYKNNQKIKTAKNGRRFYIDSFSSFGLAFTIYKVFFFFFFLLLSDFPNIFY